MRAPKKSSNSAAAPARNAHTSQTVLSPPNCGFECYGLISPTKLALGIRWPTDGDRPSILSGRMPGKFGMSNSALFARIGSMKTRIALLITCICCVALAQPQNDPPSAAGRIVNNVLFVSPGDKIGVDLAGAVDGTTLSVTESPAPKKANLVLTFKQEKGMMLFTIQNRTKYWLTYEAGIKTPKRDGLYKTSVMPVGPGLSSFESWPYPIDQLALKNFTFSEKPRGKSVSK